jgi:hypothetical protein
MSQITPDDSGASTAAFVNALKEILGEEQFEIWFGQLKCQLLKGNRVELELPTADDVRLVRERFFLEIKVAARSAFDFHGQFVWKSAEESPPLRVEQRAANSISSGYTQIPNRWIDEIRPRIGLVPWCVFETLLRFVWRGQTTLKFLQEHLDRGELVAYVSQSKLAQILNLSIRRVRSNVRTLEQLGLVQTSCRPRGRANVYVLGTKHQDEAIWFADCFLKNIK